MTQLASSGALVAWLQSLSSGLSALALEDQLLTVQTEAPTFPRVQVYKHNHTLSSEN